MVAVPELCQLPKFFPGSIYDVPEYSIFSTTVDGGTEGASAEGDGRGSTSYIECEEAK